MGVRIPAFWAGVLGLAINYSAYEAENYRAGLLAVPKGQMEAALSLGMSRRTALWRVVESGPPAQVFGDPREEVTKSFLSEVS